MSRTNFIKVTNLPQNLQSVAELYDIFSSCGVIQDITAVDSSTVIVSYAMRSQAKQAEFALNNVNIAGNYVTVVSYFPASDPQFRTNPAYQRLGQYIGQDHHVMDPKSFRPWAGGARHKSNISQAAGAIYASNGPSGPFAGAAVGAAGAAGAAVGGDMISANTVPWERTSGECNICLSDHDESSLTLSQCGHTYHLACLQQLLQSSAREFLQCPTCKKVYGVKTGTMPTTGSISHRITTTRLAGYETVGCIEVEFRFERGVQGPEHPHPGLPFSVDNFPRVAYLPDTDQGVDALHGIYLAWAQRLMFTVGRSITTGRDNCVTWNDIHMKTNPSGGAHGYPDPSYLKNLLQDLSGFGITDAAISEHRRKRPDLKTRGRL